MCSIKVNIAKMILKNARMILHFTQFLSTGTTIPFNFQAWNYNDLKKINQ